MRRALQALLVLAAGSVSSCGVCPPIHCLRLLTVEFVDASGAPLTPSSVTEDGRVHPCSEGAPTTCEGHRLTFDSSSTDAATLRAQAATGEAFEGTVKPRWERTRQVAAGSCECSAETATVKVTLAR